MSRRLSPASQRSSAPDAAERRASLGGLYRRCFTQAERDLLDLAGEQDGSSEFHLLRILLGRTVVAANRRAGGGWLQQAALLSAFSRTVLHLAALARFRHSFARYLPDPELEAMAARDLEDL